ncbi:MAG: serine/threonine-protein kinase [Gemmatimonadota bacterium]
MDQTRILDLETRLRAVVAGQFEIGELLGSGGFAAVFRARDTLLGRDVAIKVLDPSLALDAGAADRLLDEARIVASTEHGNIVPLYEAGHQDGIVYLVMRYYPDGSVTTRLARDGRWTPAQVARLGVGVAEALAAAHGRGVLHLDVKPDNILLDDAGHPALVDFGIARLIAAQEDSQRGMVSGTPHYMSPEQVAGDDLDGRSDVYALGVVLYEVATGRRPISGDSAKAVMANHLRELPEQLSSVVPEMPAALAAIIMQAMAKAPDDRFASAKDMATALAAASTPDQMLTPRVARRRVRRRWYSRGAMVGCGALLAFAAVVYVVVRFLKVFLTGEPPAIDAFRDMIPGPLADSARSIARLSDEDTLVYIFAPHAKGMSNALIITAQDIIPVTGGLPKLFPIAANNSIDIKRTPNQGFLLIKTPGLKVVDTIYRDMTGPEQQALMLGLKRVFP